MTLQIYNTLSRQKKPFEPLEAGKVSIYCCGVTVYDYCHLGHARCYMVWDTVRRYLMWRGYDVRYVQNFTDAGVHLFDNIPINAVVGFTLPSRMSLYWKMRGRIG